MMVAGACSIHPGDAVGSHFASATFRTVAGAVRIDRLPVADTDAERERGLMGRTSLAPDGGMVFRFPAPSDSAFWMKDTPIPLSVAFVGGDRRIVDILDMAPCAGDPCPLYRSSTSYRTAIEMRAGWFSAHAIRIGDEVALSYGRG
jgi:uncharacterized protein